MAKRKGTKVKLSVTVEADTLRRVVHWAKQEQRSLSNTVGVLLDRGLRVGSR